MAAPNHTHPGPASSRRLSEPRAVSHPRGNGSGARGRLAGQLELDVAGGVLCGLDVVVWPEVDTVPGLAPPAGARSGRVVLPTKSARQVVSAVEVDTTLSVSATPDEKVVHLRIGGRRDVEVVRVADHLLVELDHKRRLAGFWLTEVPPFAPT